MSDTEFRKDGFKKDGAKKEFHKDGKKPFGTGKKDFHKDGKKPFRSGDKKDFRKGGKPKSSDARKLVLTALCDVTIHDAYANIALGKRLRESNMEIDDKRLATNIFYTALENRRYIDYVLSQFVDSMPSEPVVREILHLSVAQLLFMDKVPDYAVVNEAVKLVKMYFHDQYVSLVNGVLRSVTRARDAKEIKEPQTDNLARYLSIMYSLPETVVARLLNDYGEEMTRAIVSYRPEDHSECVHANLNMITDDEFEELMEKRNWHYNKGTVPHSYHLFAAGDLPTDPDYRKGLFSIKSESSMLAAMAVGAKGGMNILDACAAPGGKTTLMSMLMHDTGRIFAYDVHAHRVELIRAEAQRLRLYNIRPVEADATIPCPDHENALDAVLLDAPCSGLGVMAGKPDLKMRVKEDEIENTIRTQKALLDTCCNYVKVGGTLVYSTCTLLKDENENQVRAFLERHPEFEMDKKFDWLPESLKPLLNEDGMLQLFAHRDRGMEGFFIAKMRRVK